MAKSVTVIVPVTGLPSVVSVIVPLWMPVLVAGEVAFADSTPDRLSEVVNGTTTGALYQFGALGVEVVAPNVNVGFTVSIIMFGGVPPGTTVGWETGVAVARTSAALFT